MIEHAHGGTLFLDEIADMPLPLQAKLLRFLQERTIVRLGGREPIEVDTRVVSATNQNLAQAMSQGQFREDLYYRLSEVSVEIPPLREREGDAVLIAQVLLDRLTSKSGHSGKEAERGCYSCRGKLQLGPAMCGNLKAVLSARFS